MVLGFSIDEFISENFLKSTDNEANKVSETQSEPERVSVPDINVPKFKNVLLYILEKSAGKPNVGETVINKLLYFSDFNYYELHEEHLTGASYKKLPYGPVPKNLDNILADMLEKGELQRVKSEYHGYAQTRYLPLIKTDLTLLKASEKEVIDKVIEQMSDWSASAISDYSHRDMPWLASKEGEEINYELVFYRETPFTVRNYEND